MALALHRFTVGPLQENCYLLADEASRKAVLVDPGDEPARLLAALEPQRLELQAIWLTHAHFDHLGALAAVLAVREVPVYLHPADRILYQRAAESAALWGLPLEQPQAETLALEDGQRLGLASHEVRCLHTPGHAPGHIAFYLPAEGLVLAGDALFQGSIGRTDLPFGDHGQLIRSIRDKLLTLPDETVVYPGHGPETTVGAERRHNPFLQGA